MTLPKQGERPDERYVIVNGRYAVDATLPDEPTGVYDLSQPDEPCVYVAQDSDEADRWIEDTMAQTGVWLTGANGLAHFFPDSLSGRGGARSACLRWWATTEDRAAGQLERRCHECAEHPA